MSRINIFIILTFFAFSCKNPSEPKVNPTEEGTTEYQEQMRNIETEAMEWDAEKVRGFTLEMAAFLKFMDKYASIADNKGLNISLENLNKKIQNDLQKLEAGLDKASKDMVINVGEIELSSEYSDLLNQMKQIDNGGFTKEYLQHAMEIYQDKMQLMNEAENQVVIIELRNWIKDAKPLLTDHYNLLETYESEL